MNMEGTLSMIHLNSRSFYKNVIHIKDCVSLINVMSETWLDNEKIHEVIRRVELVYGKQS